MRINNLDTFRFAYQRFLVIELSVCAAYSIINYFVLQHIESISDTTKTFFFPVAVTFVAYIFFYRARIKMMPKLRADEFRGWVIILMLVAAPPVILQLIVEEKAVQVVNVASNQPIPFNTGKSEINLTEPAIVDTSSVGVYCRTYTSYRKNGRDDRHYEAYIVGRVLSSNQGSGTLWYGEKISHIDQRDNSSDEEIQMKFQNIRDTAELHFRSRLNKVTITRLEINPSTPAFRDFERAVTNSRASSMTDVVIATDVTPHKSISFKFKAFIITLLATQSIWAIVCIFIRVNESRLDEYQEMSSSDRKRRSLRDFTEALQWITPRKDYLVTPLLLITNILVYLIMGIVGVGFDAPDSYEMIKWGSDYGPLIREGQIWRWVTSGFLHFGFIHIMMNMFALGYSGYIMERVIGSSRMAILYFSSVIGSSIFSNVMHDFQQNSAGASGGIFGIMGAMLIYALFNIGKSDNRIIMIMVFAFFALPTIFSGIAGWSHADNAGHLGGIITGSIVSLFFIPKVKAAKDVFEE